jgi:hypothetical protein
MHALTCSNHYRLCVGATYFSTMLAVLISQSVTLYTAEGKKNNYYYYFGSLIIGHNNRMKHGPINLIVEKESCILTCSVEVPAKESPFACRLRPPSG